MLGKDESSSHLLTYLHAMNRNGHVPKGFGMVHRRGGVNEIDANEIQMTDAHAKALAGSVGRAKYVNKLILKNVGLRDDQAIDIIKNMDKQVVNHLDISYNPLLTKKFYNELNEILCDPTSGLERVELEGNNIGDQILHDMVQAMVTAKNIVYLNVS